eukprot:6175869-Pleurochrysis_carterae.AAC.5
MATRLRKAWTWTAERVACLRVSASAAFVARASSEGRASLHSVTPDQNKHVACSGHRDSSAEGMRAFVQTHTKHPCSCTPSQPSAPTSDTHTSVRTNKNA